MDIILYCFGLVLVFYLLAKVCDEYFVGSLDIIAKKLKLSEDVAGATFMAIGTSAPEFFTAALALVKAGSEEVGAGTIVGSAIFNILVIVGASSVVATAYLKWQPVVRDMGFYIIAILVLLFTFRDGTVTIIEAVSYLVAYGFYIFILARWGRWFPGARTEDQLGQVEQRVIEAEHQLEARKGLIAGASRAIERLMALTFPNLKRHPNRYPLTFTISILYIIALSWVLVELGVGLAHALHIPPVIIALTILAGGTSVPDLLGSLIVAKKGRGDMAVSNAVGSNTFDILICLGLPWLVYIIATGRPVTVDTGSLMSSVFLLFATVVAIFFVLFIRKFKIGRKAGFLLLFLYAAYLAYAVVAAYYPSLLT